MRDFFGSRLLRWLTVPYRSRLFTMASKPFYQVADRVLGSRFLQDIAEFFILFQTMEPGFVKRAKQVERLLTDQRTTFVVVSTLEAAPAHESAYLAAALRERQMSLGALVLNRTLPAEIRRPAAARAADELRAAATGKALVERLAGSAAVTPAATPAEVGDVLAEVAERFADIAVVAGREAQRRRSLATVSPLVVEAPTMRDDIHDIAGLLALGAHLL